MRLGGLHVLLNRPSLFEQRHLFELWVLDVTQILCGHIRLLRLLHCIGIALIVALLHPI